MHSHIGPWEEANRLYVEQSRLADKLAGPGHDPLVIYDVGMGIAANALASIQCRQSIPNARPLHIVSFEHDLSGLDLALAHHRRFPFFTGFLAAIESLRRDRAWKSEGISWTLLEGRFEHTCGAGLPEPELIYFDFYSPKTCPELWTEANFRKLFAACVGRRARGLGTELYTYSSATSIRSAILLAGFHCGTGIATESKAETTVAATRLQDLAAPLGAEWFDKFMRSSKPLPEDWHLSRFHEARARIERMAQFTAPEPPRSDG